MKREFILLIMFLLLSSLPVLAQDMLIDENGNVGIGTMNPSARLEVVGLANGEGVVGLISGTGTGVYGENTTTGNYGLLGNNYYGVFGYSSNSYAGYFSGDARVTGNLIVDGVLTGAGIADITGVNAGTGLTGGGTSGEVIINVEFGGSGSAASASRSDHGHEGSDITGGVIFETFIDPAIARVQEIMPFVIANDGAGSGLDADTLDGKDSTGFADSVLVQTLETRVTTLEGEEAKTFVVRAARAVSDRTYTAEPELEQWLAAVRKGDPSHPLRNLTEIDTDGDGTVMPGTDLNNLVFATAGLVTTWVSASNAKGLVSPWNGFLPLWRDGGQAANQAACDAVAVASPGQISLCYNYGQSHYMKSLFISAVDNDPTPNVICRKSLRAYFEGKLAEEMTATAEKAVPELEKWLAAVRKGEPEHPLSDLTEVDTDGDGALIVGIDLTNQALAAAGIVTQFVTATSNVNGVNQRSPWNAALPLWTDGGATANQAACDAVAIASPGQISLCYNYGQSHYMKSLFISAADYEPAANIIYSKSLRDYSEDELTEKVAATAEKALPELEKWLVAVRKGDVMHPLSRLTEVDTDGDGALIVGTDMINQALATEGLVTRFVIATSNVNGLNQLSPWNAALPLWVDGGVAANQHACNAMAQGTPGQISLCYNNGQSKEMKNLFISAVDNEPMPNVIYSKSLSAYSEDELRSSIINSAKDAMPELEGWVKAVQKAGTLEGNITELDTDGDGAVIWGTDLNNNQLSSAGLVTTWITSRTNLYGMNQRAPWNAALPLWRDGGVVANQAACDMTAVTNQGQITICYLQQQNNLVRALFISATDDEPTPNIVYHGSVEGYSERERMDATIKAAEEAVPELEKWIRAVRKGQFHEGEGLFTEVDTDGSGIVVEGTDLDNFNISMVGVVTQFIWSRSNMDQRSLWNGYNDLWLYGGPAASQAACNAVSAASPGQIVLCSYPYEDFSVEAVFVSASNKYGQLLYQKTLNVN